MERRKMDADGGRVVHRRKRTRRLAIVVAVQNVLVTACLAVTLYVYWDVQSRPLRTEQPFGNNMHIEFAAISDIPGNVTLSFPEVSSQNQMILVNKKDKIYINCTGPYVLYVHLCYLDFLEQNATGTLQLQVAGEEEKTPFSFPTLYATAHEVCRMLHDIVYLSKKNEASLHLISSPGFKIKHARVGLSYLLGSQCVYQ
ncbi:uncharacterized protein LOC144463647 [Epinephelus lanceolatus]